MCSCSARSQRLIVEECLKFVVFLHIGLFHLFLMAFPMQMDISTKSFWKTSEFTSCHSQQNGWHDLSCGGLPSMVGERHLSDVQHGSCFAFYFRIPVDLFLYIVI